MTVEERQEYDKLISRSHDRFLSKENKRRLNELGKLSVESKKSEFDYEWDTAQLKKDRNGKRKQD